MNNYNCTLNDLRKKIDKLEKIIKDLPSEEDLMLENFKYFSMKNYAFMLGVIVEAVRIAKMEVKR